MILNRFKIKICNNKLQINTFYFTTYKETHFHFLKCFEKMQVNEDVKCTWQDEKSEGIFDYP